MARRQSLATPSPTNGIVIDLNARVEEFTLEYESLHGGDSRPWCTVRVYRQPGVTVIIATDETNTHEGVSVTNRVERVMYLAWEKIGRPTPCAFIEHYRHTRFVSEHYDLVEFERDGFGPKTAQCWSGGRDIGPQFVKPNWTALRRANILLPPQYGRR